MHKAIAVISDIHSNLEALEAVLADLKSQEVSEIVCLGDIVGYASGVKSCMRVVQELDCPVVMGNHDEAACLPSPPDDFNEAARFGAQFSARRLTAMDRSWLSTLPRNVEIDGVLFTQPDGGLHGLHLAEERAHTSECEMTPVLQQASRFRSDLPLIRISSSSKGSDVTSRLPKTLLWPSLNTPPCSSIGNQRLGLSWFPEQTATGERNPARAWVARMISDSSTPRLLIKSPAMTIRSTFCSASHW